MITRIILGVKIEVLVDNSGFVQEVINEISDIKHIDMIAEISNGFLFLGKEICHVRHDEPFGSFTHPTGNEQELLRTIIMQLIGYDTIVEMTEEEGSSYFKYHVLQNQS